MHISHSFLDVQMADLVKPVRILVRDCLRVSNIQGKTNIEDKCVLPSKIVSSNPQTSRVYTVQLFTLPQIVYTTKQPEYSYANPHTGGVESYCAEKGA